MRLVCHEQVELYKEHYTNNCVIEKESESTKHLYNAEMHTYHVSVVKSNVHMIGELSVIYNKSERKRCVIESMHLPEDKIVNEIIKTLRYK